MISITRTSVVTPPDGVRKLPISDAWRLIFGLGAPKWKINVVGRVDGPTVTVEVDVTVDVPRTICGIRKLPKYHDTRN
jgi:hypothetical protein